MSSKTYLLASPLRLKDVIELTEMKPNLFIRAVATGEKRAPRKGEWFLSGATPEAYHATNDLSTPYPIAKLITEELPKSEDDEWDDCMASAAKLYHVHIELVRAARCRDREALAQYVDQGRQLLQVLSASSRKKPQ